VNSEIGFIINKNKRLFRDYNEAEDNIFYVFVMYERLKGFKSFWYPYWEIVDGMDLVMGWTEEEMDEL